MVDEFVVAFVPGDDDAEKKLLEISNPEIRIILKLEKWFSFRFNKMFS